MASGGSRRWRQGAALGLLLGLLLLLLGVTGSARLERADFVFNNGTELSTLDPATVTGVPEGRVIRAVFEGLTVKHPETLEPLPGVARSWEVSEDGLIVTFELREDALWTSGDPVTAHDFTWSWERLLDPSTTAEYAYQLWYVEGAEPYSLLPDDRWYGNMIHGTWLKELGGGRARIGMHGFALGERDPAESFEVTVAEGHELTDLHDPFVDFPDGHVHAHALGRVLAVNPDLPATVGELLEDPYEAGWLIELELAEGALELAQQENELFPADVAREEIFWPRVGVRAFGDHTLEVRLRAPTPFFLDLASFYPLFPVNKKAIEDAQARFPETWQVEWVRAENIVTNGPFRVAERRVNDRIRLVKNPTYWDADAVAMNTIDITAVEHYGTMLNLYLTGGADWIERVAPNLVHRLKGREDFRPEPYLGTYFYRVNTTRPPMDDVRVRRALALTIDRRAICEKIMKKGERPNWGLVPHGMAGYPNAEMDHAPVGGDDGAAGGLEGYEQAFAADCERARGIIAEAGYGPGGRPFPTIEIHYNTSEAHRDIAEVIADSWKRNLGIDAKLQNQEWKVYLDTQRTLQYDVSRSAWIGDYPDPNTFLDLFVTGGENNKTGWGDARFDELIRQAAAELDATQRMQLLHEAEAILIEALPVLPIYTYVTQNLVKPRLGGFHENILDEHFMKFLYWMDDEELAAKRELAPAWLERVEPGGPSAGLYSPAQERARSNR